nr:MAG TPA: hypothetical protein [Caudoviricetes sp.]
MSVVFFNLSSMGVFKSIVAELPFASKALT